MSGLNAKVTTTGEKREQSDSDTAAPEPKPEPKGYTRKRYFKTKDGVIPSFHCDSCRHGTLTEVAMQKHVSAVHRGKKE